MAGQYPQVHQRIGIAGKERNYLLILCIGFLVAPMLDQDAAQFVLGPGLMRIYSDGFAQRGHCSLPIASLHLAAGNAGLRGSIVRVEPESTHQIRNLIAIEAEAIANYFYSSPDEEERHGSN